MDTNMNRPTSPSTPTSSHRRRRPPTPQRPVFGFPVSTTTTTTTTTQTHHFHPVRATSSSSKRRKQYPVPVAVTLYNLFPPPRATQPSQENAEDDDDDDDHNGMLIMYRKRNPLELLVPVRLDIVSTQEVIVSTSLPCETNALLNSKRSEKGITDEKKMDHLNEQMEESNNTEEHDKKKEDDVSKQSLLDQEEEEQESNIVTEELQLYSGVHARMELNPKWDLLDERVDLIGMNRPDEEDQGHGDRRRRQDDDDGPTAKPLSPNEEENEQQWDSIYRSMRARFILPQDRKITVTKPLTTIPAASVKGEGNNVDGHEQQMLEQSDPRELQKLISEISLENVSPYRHNHPTPKEMNKTDMQELVSDISLLDLPLHPTLLRRLPNQESSMFGSGNSNIPTSLPPNAVLVDYSDGSTRVNPSIYRLLLRSGVIDEDPQNDEYVADDIVEENKRERRFSDNAFEALDDTGIWDNAEPTANAKPNTHGAMVVDRVVTLNSPPSNESESGEASNVSTLIDDEVFALLGPSGGRVQDDIKHQSFQQTPSLMLDSRSTTPSVADPSEIDNDNISQQDTARRNDVDEKNALNTKDGDTSEQNGHSDFGPCENKFVMEHLCNELLSLEAELQAEKMAFSNDKQLLEKEIAEIKTLNNQINENEEDTRLIAHATRAELDEVKELEFLLETRQAKLLMDLRTIYPIQAIGVTLSSKVQYLIRGIEVPIDLYGPQVLDEEVSAALGFLCHLVFMVSKYLSIPLRYKVICNSSRSAIQDDGRGIFPLFKERVVEQKQLDRAMFLLHRDVDCILIMRGIDFVPRSHILSKVELLFSQTLQSHQGPV